MFTFTLSQSIWEFGKSRVIRAIRASGLRTNVPSACQLLIFTCQRANKHANVPEVCQLFNVESIVA